MNQCKYLDMIISNITGDNIKIEKIITKGRKTIRTLNNLIKSKLMARKSKEGIYNTVIQPSVMYVNKTSV